MNAKIISWTAATKNRITIDKMKDAGFNYKNVKMDFDSLTFYFDRLKPTNDSIYNLRFYGKIKGKECRRIKEIFIDKSGVIQIDGKHFTKDVKFTYFLLRHIVTDNKKELFPPW